MELFEKYYNCYYQVVRHILMEAETSPVTENRMRELSERYGYQESALAIMEERIDAISAIADRNLQNSTGTEHSSGLLAREAEALAAQVKKFVLKEEHDR